MFSLKKAFGLASQRFIYFSALAESVFEKDRVFVGRGCEQTFIILQSEAAYFRSAFTEARAKKALLSSC